MQRYKQIPVTIVLSILTAVAHGETTITSAREQANLIELYTSEGCSSCPPADRWLSTLKNHPELWKSLVPIAFHVDYWDYIGWKDRFAQPQFADRQRQYARENGMATIYTPGLMSNGNEWRNFGWRAPKASPDGEAGRLSGVVGDDQVAIRFQAAQLRGGKTLTVSVALLGFGIATDVRAGENRGKKLIHDFVVLEHVQMPMKFEDGAYRAVAGLPESAVAAEKFALTFWVSEDETQAPLQAAGGWL